MAAIRLRKHVQREWLLALAGVVSLVFGMLVFLFPAAGTLAMVFMVNFCAMLSAILRLVLTFRARKWVKRSGPQADLSSAVIQDSLRHSKILPQAAAHLPRRT